MNRQIPDFARSALVLLVSGALLLSCPIVAPASAYAAGVSLMPASEPGQAPGQDAGAAQALPAGQAVPPVTPSQTPPAGQAAPAAAPGKAQPAPAQAQPPAGTPARIGFHLSNAPLQQVIEIIGSELKMNMIVDPQVKGVVNINTWGDLRQEDLLAVLQAVLRTNGATAVQSGEFWRIVMLKDAPRVPFGLMQESSPEKIPEDDRMIMNVVALGYIGAGDMSRIIGNYLSEAGQILVHEAGNLLLITDTSRSMRRVMEMIRMFDNESLANQRFRLFAIQNAQAKDVASDLSSVFSAYAMSDKAAVKFVPIERINSILVVTGTPKVYDDVKSWIEKLDQPVKKTGMQNFVYKVENGSAENIASVLQTLYGSGPARSTRAVSGAPGVPGAAAGVTGSMGAPSGGVPGGFPQASAVSPAATSGESSAVATGLLQAAVRIVADSINNSIIIQSTAQDYETIRKTIKELDIVPRQVMIEARVYEVRLTGALAFGVEYFLRQRSDAQRKPLGQFAVGASSVFPNPGVSASAGFLIGRTRELLTFLNAQESRTRTKIVSAPTVFASDNTEAHINVGAEVPLLTSQGVVQGAQVGGTSLFTNTIQNRDTGIILSVMPRINASGLVTLKIQQEVSQPVPPAAGAIQSPSISKRSISTQVSIQDGETVALGGIISENKLISKSRIPLLGDIPIIGVLFGATSYSTDRTELIVTLTPHVLRETGDVTDATEEFRDRLREIKKAFRTDPIDRK